MPSGCCSLIVSPASRAGSSCPRRSRRRRRRRGVVGGVVGEVRVDEQPAALAEELDRVAPQHAVDVVGGEAGLEHRRTGLRGLERVAAAPVGGRVDQHPVEAAALQDRDHPVLVHLGVGVDREAHPAAGLVDLVDGDLVEVVDDDHAGREARLGDELEGAAGALLLVAVGRVDHRRQLELDGELQLPHERLLLLDGHRVEADLTHGDHAVLGEVAREHVEHLGAPRVVGLLGVERDRAVVGDAELRGAEPLPAHEGVEVVGERADAGARLAQPERRLDERAHAGGVHRLVVVGGARRHVDVRVEDAHQESFCWACSGEAAQASRTTCTSRGTSRPAASRSRW